jgi:hypothetical protein
MLHHPKNHCLPLPASLSAHNRPCCTTFSSFQQLQLNQWLECQLPSHMPADLPPPDSLPSDSLPPDWLPPDRPPSDQLPQDQLPPNTHPIMIDHALQVYLLTRLIFTAKIISESMQFRHSSALPNTLNHCRQVHLWVHLISRSPSASPGLDDHGLQVPLQVMTAVVWKYRGIGGWQSDGENLFGWPQSW